MTDGCGDLFVRSACWEREQCRLWVGDVEDGTGGIACCQKVAAVTGCFRVVRSACCELVVAVTGRGHDYGF